MLANVELALTISGVSGRRAPPPRRRGAGEGGPGQPAAQAPQRDVRRPDAARGHRPRPGQQPRHPAGRRAHRRTGQRDQHPGHGTAQGGGPGPPGGHGHPQPGAGRAATPPASSR